MSSSSLSNQALQASLWSYLGGNGNSPSNLRALMPNQQHHAGTGSPSSHMRGHSESVEELLKSDFNKLPSHEKAKALKDIQSGSGSELKENPLVIHKLLIDFEQQVEQGKYPIYKRALKQDRSYVEDPSFRLMFLRASLHDVEEAVKQMITFLELKAKYFGAETVARDITFDDLTPDELKVMLSGHYHIQDGTDCHGRKILHIFSSDLAEDVDSEIRIIYFISFNILAKIHSVQMKGLVIVYGLAKPIDKQTNPGHQGMKRFSDFVLSLPIRLSAFHLCAKRDGGSTDPLRHPFLQFSVKAMPQYMRVRSCVHRGSTIELQHKLSTYGIPQDTFPVDVSGNVREGIRNVWFYKYIVSEGGITRHVLEENGDSSFSAHEELSQRMESSSAGEEDTDSSEGQLEIIRRPYSNRDVLVGRGFGFQNHPGNVAFRSFLDQHQEEYDGARRNSRRNIAKNITRTLKANGVRFWKKTDDGSWVEATASETEEKVSQLFRSARKRNNR